MTHRGVSTAAVFAILALVAVGCGSTAKKSAVSGDQTGAADVAPDAAAPGTQAGAKSSATTGGGANGSPSSVLGPQQAGAPVSGIVTRKHLRVAPGTPGVTDKYIYVGAAYTKNQGAANAAFGVQGLDQGDARRPYNVVINDINAHGGLAGRKIKPIYYGYDATSTQTIDQQDEDACATWTEDNKVLVVLSGGDIVDACTHKIGALQFAGGALPETFKKYPHRIDIDGLNRIRLATRTVEGLHSKGFFEKGAKIGLVTWDDPHYHQAVDRGIVPALKRRGLKLGIATAYITPPQTLQEIGATSADVNSAVLRFNTNNVTHVMVLDGASGLCGGACITIEWLKQADSQRYFPRNGFNDTNSPKELRGLGILSDEQAHRSVYVNWLSANDTYDEGLKPNRARQRCEALQRKHGVDMTDPNARGAAINACADLWFLQIGISRLSSILGADAFIHAVNKLGYSYRSPFSWHNFFSPTRHDGNAGERIAVFKDAPGECRCFKYVTGAYKI